MKNLLGPRTQEVFASAFVALAYIRSRPDTNFKVRIC